MANNYEMFKRHNADYQKTETGFELKNREYLINTSDLLGEGAFGKVYKGVHVPTGDLLAVKAIKKSQPGVDDKWMNESLQNEISILKETSALNNSNLLKYYETIKTTDEVFIITEFCDNGCQEDEINRSEKDGWFTEERALDVFYQIACGLHALAECKIVHRDMKTENIFIKGDRYKIGDLGLSKKGFGKFYNNCGTETYQAPEFFDENCKYLTPKVDIWALGFILHQMLFGDYPFQNEDEIKNLRYEIPPKEPRLKEDTKFLQKQCLIKNDVKRISAFDLIKHKAFEPVKARLAKGLKFGEEGANPNQKIVDQFENQKITQEDPEQDTTSNSTVYDNLQAYKNVANYYYECGKFQEENDNKGLLRYFILSKRAFQKYSILNKFLEKLMHDSHHEDLKLGSITEQELKSFKNEKNYKTQLNDTNNELAIAQEFYEKIYKVCDEKYANPNENIQKLLDKNLELNINEDVELAIDKAVAFYRGMTINQNSENTFKATIYLDLLKHYEENRPIQALTNNYKKLVEQPTGLGPSEKKQFMDKYLHTVFEAPEEP